MNLKTMFYNVERDFDQEVRYIASFMGEFLEGDLQVKEKIGQYVALKGLRPEMQSAVVMWWRISSKYSQKLSIPKFRPQRLKRKGFLI